MYPFFVSLHVLCCRVLITVVLAIVVQLGIDLIYPLLDPRVRLGKAAGK